MENRQLTLDDMAFQKYISEQPGRVAYIDECGNFGFDFSKDGTSKYYILTAIVVENSNIESLRSEFAEIKRTNGLANTELKSSLISEDKRRNRIITQLLPLNFRIVLFIADKELFRENSPLAEYKPVFVKYLNNRLYTLLYKAYPKLKILYDETGYPEFQESFRKYVESNRTDFNLFNEYDFAFVNSKDETLIQIADFIGGSVSRSLLDETATNYLEMLKGKITTTEYFPNRYEPYWGKVKPEDCKFDKQIYTLAIKSARDFITQNENSNADDKKAQVAMLRYLLFSVENTPIRFVYSDEIINNIYANIGRKIKKDFLFRRVVAPLRDSGVILASCNQGYKIPVSVDDINTYLNQTTSTVGPMLNRMGICRSLIKRSTDNGLDVFDDAAFIRYKRYFDE